MKKIIERIKVNVETKCGKSAANWLEGLKIYAMTEEKVILCCRSSFAADVVKARFIDEIEEALVEVCGFVIPPEILTVEEEYCQLLQKKSALEEDCKVVYNEFLSVRKDIEAAKEEIDVLLRILSKAEEEYGKLN